MHSTAVLMSGPKDIALRAVDLIAPGAADVVVKVAYSGISTGTEKLFWSGTMPPFPGMGYPLVPGYEAAGEVVEAGPESGLRVGDTVFVPGANCYQAGQDGPVRGLFGAASQYLVTAGARTARLNTGHLDAGWGAEVAAPIARRVFDYWLLGQYPNDEDLAAVRKGQGGPPIGKPRAKAEVDLASSQ